MCEDISFTLKTTLKLSGKEMQKKNTHNNQLKVIELYIKKGTM